MTPTILGIGTQVPEHQMSQPDALRMTQEICCDNERERRLASILFRRSGVENRHTVVPHPIAYEWARTQTADGTIVRGPSTGERMQMYAEFAPPLGAAAARRALADARIDPQSITHLVTVSCTGFDAPGIDINLYGALGLRPTVERVHVGYMGCHGAMNGLRVARGLLAAEPQGRVLLVACELCSLHYRFHWDDEGIIGNALFADGAAALVLGAPPPASDRGPSLSWHITSGGSCLLPESQDSMSWRVGDAGFEMRLTSDVPERIETHLRDWLAGWLDRHGAGLSDVDHWIVHPGGPRILDAVETALGLPAEATQLSREILRTCGNMSSPTVLFVLERLIRASASGRCVMLGFGPGLMAEVCGLSTGSSD